MVSVVESALLATQRSQIVSNIKEAQIQSDSHVTAFARRVLGPQVALEVELRAEDVGEAAVYGGYPEVARLGFQLGVGYPLYSNDRVQFLAGLERLQQRSQQRKSSFYLDDIAILGIADGLSTLDSSHSRVDVAKQWLVSIIDHLPKTDLWTSRVRDLAGDLLDSKGRLRMVSNGQHDYNAQVLELVLQDVWHVQIGPIAAPPSEINQQKLLDYLLKTPPPKDELEMAAIWLKGLDLLTEKVSRTLLPNRDMVTVAVGQLHTIKLALDRRAERLAKRSLWLGTTLWLIIWLAVAVAIHELTWDVMEQYTYLLDIVIGLLPYLYFAITQREFSPQEMYRKLVCRKRQDLYQEVNFNVEEYERLLQHTE